MTGLVLLQHGLDVTLPLDPGDGAAVRHRGEGRVDVVNPADRCALEWATRVSDGVTALTVGPAAAHAVVELAVARGARRGIRVWDEALGRVDAAALSRVLVHAVRALAPDLVLAGERGLEGATGIVPALLAARLGWPCLAEAIRVVREPGGVMIERRLGGGRRAEVAAGCPLVVTVAAGSIEPRYVSVRARRRAPPSRVETWDLARLGLTRVTVESWVRLVVERADWPRPRPRRTAAAARGLSAADRMRQLTGGGGGRAARPAPDAPVLARVLEGEPGHVADRLLAFLASRGLVP